MLSRTTSYFACLAALVSALFVGGCAKPAGSGGGTGGSGGGVTCTASQTACGSVCKNVQTDSQNCGACGTVCQSGQTCQSGKCGCTSGMLCGSSCVTSDATHCGSCSTVCPAASPVCNNNQCSSSCSSGQTQCGTACTSTSTDSNNCGSCGTICPAGATCSGGSCGCSGSQKLCGATCLDTSADNSNCGSCGNACGSGKNCTNGACVTTSTTGTGGSGGSTGTGGASTGGSTGTGGASTGGATGSGGKGGTTGTGGTGTGGSSTVVDAGADLYPCTNTSDMSQLPIDPSGFVQERCDTYGIQGAWYCYADTTLPGGSASNNGSSDCVDHVVPYVAASNGMCISGKTSTNSGAYGAAIGLELNTPGAVGGVDQTKQAYNATSHNVYGFEITITNYKGATDNYALRLTWTTGAMTTVTQPFVDLPGPGTYDVYFGDAVVPGSFADTSAGMRVNAASIYDLQLAIPQEGTTAVTYGYCITKLKPITTPQTAPTSCGTLANYGGPACGLQDLLGEVGNYGVENNISGTGSQCIQAKSGGGCAGFTLTNPNGSLNGSSFPAAYPAVVYGWQAGSYYGGYKTPKQLMNIGTVPSSWTFTTPSDGQSDTSYDIWLAPSISGGPKTANGGLELMIWMNHTGANPVGFPCSVKSNATIGSAPGTWDLCSGSVSVNGSTWAYLAYVAHSGQASFSNVDLMSFFKDAETETLYNNTKISTSWYLLGIQAGFEVTQTTGGSVNSFSVSVN